MTYHQLTRRRVLTLTSGAAAVGLAGCLGDDTDPADDHAEEHAGVVAERDAYVVTYHWGYAAFDESGNELDEIEVEPNTELTLYAVNDHAYDAFEELPDPVAAELKDFDALERTKQKVEAGDIPEPSDGTIEEFYDEAHGRGHDDDGHDDNSHSIRRLHDEGDDDGHGHDDDGHGHDDDDGHGHDEDDDGHGHDDDDDGHGHDDDDDHGHDDDGHGHDDAMLDHGLVVGELGIQMDVPGDMDEPAEATAVVEEPGTYEARCTVGCGYGHTHQQEPLIYCTDE